MSPVDAYQFIHREYEDGSYHVVMPRGHGDQFPAPVKNQQEIQWDVQFVCQPKRFVCMCSGIRHGKDVHNGHHDNQQYPSHSSYCPENPVMELW